MNRRSPAHLLGRWQILATAALGLAFVAACASSASAPNAGPANEGQLGADKQAAFGPAASAAASAGSVAAPASGPGQNQVSKDGTVTLAALDQSLIVKTGSLALQVGNMDNALTKAQTTIVGLGGYVASTQRSGSGDSSSASITFRIPAARWDDALAALRKLADKTLSEQTSTSDVTSQVIDLGARITNLQTTEKALQAIMAKADKIPDILAVEQQLSDVQGQIEQLTAQKNHLQDQAAMSTLAVAFQTPAVAVTTVATKEWDPGAQLDEAVAALVHIGQGLLTAGIWLAVVVLPVGLGLLVALAILFLVARRLGFWPRRRVESAVTPRSEA